MVNCAANQEEKWYVKHFKRWITKNLNQSKGKATDI